MSDRDGRFNFEFTLSDKCDMRCSYCFEGTYVCRDTKMSDRVFNRCVEVLDTLMGNAEFREMYPNGINIVFWGGEPTLQYDGLKKVVDHYRDNEDVNFTMYTNGYGDPTDIIELFSPLGKRAIIQVSYDGRSIHDRNRKDSEGNLTSDVVRRNMTKYKEGGIKILVKATMPIKDIDALPEAWDDCVGVYEEFRRTYSPTITFDGSPVDLKLVRDVMIQVAKREVKFYKEHGHFLLQWFTEGGIARCSYPINGICVGVDGSINICHRVLYCTEKEGLVYGTVFNDIDTIIYNIKQNKDRFDRSKAEIVNDECVTCNATYCMMCNVECHEISKKEGFVERFFDLSSLTYRCDTYREISKVKESLLNITNGRKAI